MKMCHIGNITGIAKKEDSFGLYLFSGIEK